MARDPKLSRRRLLRLAAVGGLGLVGARIFLPQWLRVEPARPLEGEVAEFVEGLFADLDRARVWDVHAHLIGSGDSGSGCRVSDSVRSFLNPIERLRYEIYLAATGVREDGQMDTTYVERLLDLQRLANPEGRLILLALDEAVAPEGELPTLPVPFFTPNEYVLELASRHVEFEAGVSIHPYRADAAERVRAAAAGGARLVKWLPAVQGIDPSSPLCDPFYEALAEVGMPLLTHAGAEAAMEGNRQVLGNPLLLRRPLNAGVKVIVAHAASLGEDVDLDAPPESPVLLPSWTLLLRLMEEPRYERLLFADISAITQFNRCGPPLRAVLRAGHLHHRFLNGSDYPLPAVDPLVSTWKLVQEGYLTDRERALCNQVYDANPLLYDFVVKRCLKLEERGRVHRFAPNVFETSWLFSQGA